VQQEHRFNDAHMDVAPQEVRAQLDRILTSRTFMKAESLTKFLRFIVERELTQERDQLREQVIAEELFGRRNFDPQTATIVRTQAPVTGAPDEVLHWRRPGAAGSHRPRKGQLCSDLPPGRERSHGAADSRVAIDPHSAEAQLALAWIRFAFDHNIQGGLHTIHKLVETAPAYPLARLLHAYALLAVGRHDEAAEGMRQAHDLDPLSVLCVYNQAVAAYFARRWLDVERFGRATVDLAQDFAEGQLALGLVFMETRRFDEALRHLERGVSKNATIGPEYVVICRCRMGQWKEAEAEFERFVEQREQGRQAYVAPHRLAIAASAFPDTERTFGYLEQAWQERDPRLIWLQAWPVFDHLHDDPRYHSLCDRLGLTVT
jgi:tetratricopeptide (TPR) repeat protein